MLKSVQTHFTDPHKPSCGHYMNKHTKERLLKRKLEAEVCSRDSATLTYNLLYIPRILKTDLRRQYPVMFMNVYNSCDYVYMKKFMDKFFRQDCEFLVEAAGRHLPVRAVSKGRENSTKAWFDRMNDAPDLCFELTSSQIRLRSDGSCTCSATFRYSGTALVYVDPNRLRTLLIICEESDAGILTLPTLFTPPSLADRSPNSVLDKKNSSPVSSSPPPIYSTANVPNFDSCWKAHQETLDPLDILKDYLHRWDEIFAVTDLTKFQRVLTTFDHLQKNQKSYFQTDIIVPKEEKEYLYSLFDNAMGLMRQYPRVPRNENETLQIGIPFQFIGDFTLQLDEDSRIYRNDMSTYLVTSSSMKIW